jgi:hypothetical protein
MVQLLRTGGEILQRSVRISSGFILRNGVVDDVSLSLRLASRLLLSHLYLGAIISVDVLVAVSVLYCYVYFTSAHSSPASPATLSELL